MMTSRSFKGSGSPKGDNAGPVVKFARRTSSGRYVNLSRESLDNDSEMEFANYTVHLPSTPDNQPMDPSISQRVEEQYVSNSLFTGGFNSATRAHLMDKVIESETNHPQMAGAKGSSCTINGCDGKVMSDERGEDIIPCECDFKICRDCYMDAVKTGDGMCPGCKEPYKNTDLAENAEDPQRPLTMTSNVSMSKMERDEAMLKRQLSHLQTNLGGIKYMTGLPDIVFIIDQHEEYTALRECITLGIPSICLIDTNCDPDLADISIPANDDAISSIRLILNKLVFTICEGVD